MKPNIFYQITVAAFLLIAKLADAQQTSYCLASGSNDYYTAINSISFADVTIPVTNPTFLAGYYDATNGPKPIVSLGDTPKLSISAVRLSVNKFYAKVYIDFNHDKQFTSDELVYSNDNSPDSTFPQAIKIPETAVAGETRVRALVSLTPLVSACNDPNNNTVGKNADVVDFTLQINCTQAAPAPTTGSSLICPATAYAYVNNLNPTFNYTWYNASSGGIVLGSNSSYSTGFSSTTTFFVEAKNSQGCVSNRVPATVVFKQCGKSNPYPIDLAISPLKSSDNLKLTISNNQTTVKNLTVTLNGGFKSNEMSKSISLSPGQKTNLEFIGDLPISRGSYSQSITIQDETTAYTVNIPIQVQLFLPSIYFSVQMISPTNYFELTNRKSSSNFSYDLIDPYGNLALSGSVPANTKTYLDLRDTQYPIGKYQIKYNDNTTTNIIVIHKI